MKIRNKDIHIVTLCSLTFTAVFVLLYAMVFGSFVNTEMHKVSDQEVTAQDLFDAQSPFSEKRQDGSQGAPDINFGPTKAPSSAGPTYPPPGN